MKKNTKDITTIIMSVMVIIYTFFMEIVNKNAITVVAWLIIQVSIFIIFNRYCDKKLLIFLSFSALLLGIYIIVNPTYSKTIIYTALVYFNMIISAIIWKQYFNNDPKYRIQKILSVFSNCGAILSVAVIIESILKKNIFFGMISRYNSSEIVGKANYVCFGSMGNHIVLVMFLSFILVISCYMFSNSKKKRFAIFSAINLIAIFMTGARTGYIFLVALLFFIFIDYIIIFIKRRRISKAKLVKFFKVALIVILTLIIFVNVFSSIFTNIISRFNILINGREKASLTHRISAIMVTLEWFLKLNPLQWFFGRGYGMLAMFLETNNLSSTEMSNFYIIDNQWMSLLYNNGIVVFCLIAIIVLKNVFEKRIINLIERKYSMLCQALFLLIATYMFSFDVFTWMASTSIIGFCYALSVQKGNMNNSDKITKNVN